MADISKWSTTAAENNSSPPDGAPENMAPSGVNDTMREGMAAVRRWYEAAEWIDLGHTPTRTGNTTFTIATDVTATYHVGRRIRCTDSSTLYGTITASSYSAPNTTVTVALDSGTLSASLSAVALGVLAATNMSLPRLGAHLLPKTDDTYALGSSTLSFSGIYLGGSSNALDLYEEGSWTPVLAGGTTPGTNTYTTQVGRYIRIGNLVVAWFHVQLSAKDAAMAGNVRVAGLPVATTNLANLFQSGMLGQVSGVNLSTGYTQVMLRGGVNAQDAVLFEAGDNVTAAAIDAAAIGDSTLIVGTIIYRTG